MEGIGEDNDTSVEAHPNGINSFSNRSIALALSGFICILTETLPAGLLLPMSDSLAISEGRVGQLITVFAIGSVLTAMPLTALTQTWSRKPLLLACIAGFLLFNSITAIATNYTVLLIARFLVGVVAGVLWGIVAIYARRLVPYELKGRAMAVAMMGTPLALALGVPIGTFFGNLVGWRFIFAAISVIAAGLLIWMSLNMPNFEGQPVGQRTTLKQVLLLPGVRSVLFVTFTWMLAHNILYSYIGPYLTLGGLEARVDVMLFIFGVTTIIGLFLVGVLIDRHLRILVLSSLTIFALAALLFGLYTTTPILIGISMGLWGLTFGVAPTLLQTAIADVGQASANVAQSMLVTAWNSGIGIAGIIGALLLNDYGAASFAWVMLVLILGALVVSGAASKAGFSK
ncbi:MFS transporter [Brochothrix thermosphacta]|uniref:MFS transporter n=1 Tax=Brochothrix thermosphacta TaxID=2756 RepID=UPI000ACCD64F|nr:MFS transporter [Brochothrix thermosphacta]